MVQALGMAILSLLISSCSIKTMAVRTTADIFSDGTSAFEEENDLELAETAIAANLKVIDGMIKSDLENETLLLLAAKSYGGYAFGFLEDHYLETKDRDLSKSKAFKRRAENLYLRGKDYALKILELKNSDFKNAMNSDFETFEQSLNQFNEGAVPALFWTAYNWGNWLNLNLESPEAIAIAPKVERMMKKVLDFDSTYFFGGPHLLYGAYFGARPPMLGGDPHKSQIHFEKALSMTKRKFLITHVLYAQYYAVQAQDQKLFEQLLKEVIDAPHDIYPEQNLITEIAKKKAERLLANRKHYF